MTVYSSDRMHVLTAISRKQVPALGQLWFGAFDAVAPVGQRSLQTVVVMVMVMVRVVLRGLARHGHAAGDAFLWLERRRLGGHLFVGFDQRGCVGGRPSLHSLHPVLPVNFVGVVWGRGMVVGGVARAPAADLHRCHAGGVQLRTVRGLGPGRRGTGMGPGHQSPGVRGGGLHVRREGGGVADAAVLLPRPLRQHPPGAGARVTHLVHPVHHVRLGLGPVRPHCGVVVASVEGGIHGLGTAHWAPHGVRQARVRRACRGVGRAHEVRRQPGLVELGRQVRVGRGRGIGGVARVDGGGVRGRVLRVAARHRVGGGIGGGRRGGADGASHLGHVACAAGWGEPGPLTAVRRGVALGVRGRASCLWRRWRPGAPTGRLGVRRWRDSEERLGIRDADIGKWLRRPRRVGVNDVLRRIRQVERVFLPGLVLLQCDRQRQLVGAALRPRLGIGWRGQSRLRVWWGGQSGLGIWRGGHPGLGVWRGGQPGLGVWRGGQPGLGVGWGRLALLGKSETGVGASQ